MVFGSGGLSYESAIYQGEVFAELKKRYFTTAQEFSNIASKGQ
jgi:hypothetical protein